MSKSDLAILNTTQAVLRGLTVLLAAASLIDMPKRASLLQAFASTQARANPIAVQRLLDLAEGLDTIAGGTRQ